MSSSLILLPTYNERENLLELMPRLFAVEDDLEVLVIDDASPDGTGEIAESLRSNYKRLSVLHRKEKEGLGRAYVFGFREALRRGYARVVTMDADLSHAPEDVPRLLCALDTADVAVGSRHVPGGGVEGWPIPRRILSRAGNIYARVLLGIVARDTTSGFRAYRAESLRAIDLESIRSRGFVFQVEILRHILDLPGTKVQEVPILFRNRTRGASKLSGKIITEALWEVAALTTRSRRFLLKHYSPPFSRERFEPLVSVVVPIRPETGEPACVKSLGALSYPIEKLEAVIVRGTTPSRQRNEAVKATSGDYILFLDDDCQVPTDIVDTYMSVFERNPTVGAVGGPAEFLAGSYFQDLASLVLGEPWVLGKSASRYRSWGRPRFSDERELILCNLCVRRAAFEAAGGFDERLYPNEENEFLERFRLSGWRLVHQPDALVKRPQSESILEFLLKIVGYGSGRTAQLHCLPSRVSLVRLSWVTLALAGFLTGLAGIVKGDLFLSSPIIFYAAYIVLLGIRFSFRGGVKKAVLAVLLSALVHGSYALGIIRGFFLRNRSKAEGEVTLERLDLSIEAPPGNCCQGVTTFSSKGRM